MPETERRLCRLWITEGGASRSPIFATMNQKLHTQSTIDEIALSLRQLRKTRGFTLRGVEEASNGLIKAVVLGSYERASRSMSIKRAIEIADFYQVPLAFLLGMKERQIATLPQTSFIIDLRRVSEMARKSDDAAVLLFIDYLKEIVRKRNDFNGEILSLRICDRENLQLILHKDHAQLNTWLKERSLLFETKLNR